MRHLALDLPCYALLALVALPSVAAAQIHKQERRLVAFVEQRRRVLLEDLRRVDAAAWQKVALVLVKNQPLQNPLLELGHALAEVRGVEADDDFLFRSGLVLYAMPEVADAKRYEHVAVTVRAPRGLGSKNEKRKVNMSVRVLDAKGKEVFRGDYEKDRVVADLRGFGTVVKVPVKDLPDGAYRAVVSTMIDGREPRAKDLEPAATFHVMRDFPARFDALSKAADERAEELSPSERGIVLGALRPVHGVWSGEPGADATLIPRHIEHLTRVVENLQQRKPLLGGATGWTLVDVPVEGGEFVQLAVHLRELGKGDRRRPLLLFIPGASSWDHRDSRPASPESVSPEYFVERLKSAGLAAYEDFEVAVCESPGRVGSSTKALQAVLKALPTLVYHDESRIVIVGKRQGAAAIDLLLMDDVERFRGVVLCNGGAGLLAGQRLAASKETRYLMLSGFGQPGGQSLLEQFGLLQDSPDRKRVSTETGIVPWLFAAELRMARIEAFAREVVNVGDERPQAKKDSPFRSPLTWGVAITAFLVVLFLWPRPRTPRSTAR